MKLDQIATPEYRSKLQAHHAQHSWGKAGASHAQTVLAFADLLGANSIIDYGCGRATLAPALSHVDRLQFQEFDPGVPGKEALPEPADLVVCTDVMEHVEESRVLAVLRHIRALSTRGAFFTIALGLSKHVFADGQNVHITIRPTGWWLEQLAAAGFHHRYGVLRKGLWVWCPLSSIPPRHMRQVVNG
jgi:hypothetical protein